MTTKKPDWVPEPKRFTLDGEPVDLAEFYADNDITPEMASEIGRLEPGQEVLLGGGAGATFVIRREA